MKIPKIIWPGSKEAEEYSDFKNLKQKEEREEREQHSGIAIINDASQNKEYLFDFLNYLSSYGGYYQRSIYLEDQPITGEEKVKIRVKPIDVVESLYCPPRNVLDVSLIDEKISLFKDKAELIHNSYSTEEVEGFIERLEYRKQYAKYKEYFEGFQVTTDEKIGELLDKHSELARKPSELFIPDFPAEAIKKMQSYNSKIREITGKKAIFYVIAESNKFRTAYDKRDPILLAQSPFGFYWYILGAWDKEMLVLSEL